MSVSRVDFSILILYHGATSDKDIFYTPCLKEQV